MRASRAVFSSSVWEIHGSVGEILATGRYCVWGGITIIDSQAIIAPFFGTKLLRVISGFRKIKLYRIMLRIVGGDSKNRNLFNNTDTYKDTHTTPGIYILI